MNLNQQLFNAQYYGQKILYTSNSSIAVQPNTAAFWNMCYDSSYLLLRRITDLTPSEWDEFKNKSSHGEQCYLKMIGVITQFGYLDKHGKVIWLMEDDLLNLGWVKLIDPTS